jgi:hypothetical protein
MDDELVFFSWLSFQKASAAARLAAAAFEAACAQSRVAGNGDEEIRAALLTLKQATGHRVDLHIGWSFLVLSFACLSSSPER